MKILLFFFFFSCYVISNDAFCSNLCEQKYLHEFAWINWHIPFGLMPVCTWADMDLCKRFDDAKNLNSVLQRQRQNRNILITRLKNLTKSSITNMLTIVTYKQHTTQIFKMLNIFIFVYKNNKLKYKYNSVFISTVIIICTYCLCRFDRIITYPKVKHYFIFKRTTTMWLWVISRMLILQLWLQEKNAFAANSRPVASCEQTPAISSYWQKFSQKQIWSKVILKKIRADLGPNLSSDYNLGSIYMMSE